MRPLIRPITAVVLFFAFVSCAHALDVPNQLTLKTDYYKMWSILPKSADFYSDYNKTLFKNIELKLLPEDQKLVEDYVNNTPVEGVDISKIRKYLEDKLAPEIFRQREDVTIDMDDKGVVTFTGNGLYGRYLDIEKSAIMLKNALENNIEFITLPIVKEDPVVTVNNQRLKDLGIKELFSAGETDFTNSPVNRINNIHVGLNKFNGYIIKPNEEFVFGNVLGPVDASTGYKQELVIKGDRTLPEYGGGLCQVSTTCYRAALAGGLPVTQRRNHSYAVSYYTPYGLDATVYPPSADLKFINNSPSSILIQTFTIGSKAYYNFYGTKDDREVYMIGPYYSAWQSPPPKKTEYSNKLAPGETQLLGHAVPGLNSSWFRDVVYNDGEGGNQDFLERIFSKYQARPDFVAIGAAQPVAEDSLENGY